MANNITTRTVGSLVKNEETVRERTPGVEHFLIPYYQRGYRWSELNVRALLEDIDNFMKSGEEYYCLQPIVVVKHIDENGFPLWEVIDGQQRLITLHIIMHYIGKEHFVIKFGQRDKSTEFLETLSEKTYNHSNPDFHFMSKAHEIIKQWFDKKSETDSVYNDRFFVELGSKAQVIWYELDHNIREEEKIAIFNRLNIGKIPLTDAELIRALLLARIKGDYTPRELLMRQAEISAEWNTIEHALHTEELWRFLNPDMKDTRDSRIEFIFDIIAGQNAKDYSTYLWFENNIKSDNPKEEAAKALGLWSRTTNIFAQFSSWFNHKNHTVYHYIGYLLAKNVKQCSVADIINHTSQTKTSLKKWLKEQVVRSLKGIDFERIEYGDPRLHKIFLLFNVLAVEKLSDASRHRFPFNLYNTTEWSIEHIHAQQSKELDDEKGMREWLTNTLNAIKGISTIEKDSLENSDDESQHQEVCIGDYVDSIEKMLSFKKINTEEFISVKNYIVDAFDSQSVHELDNLALLSGRDNSALNNAIFPDKRNKIVELEKEGRFIPPGTRNVFLKYYSTSNIQPYYWSTGDKIAYIKEIKDILNPFLTNPDNAQ